MPKILVACAAADGHVNTFLPVVSHLVKIGHDIVWLCGRAYEEKIEKTGARFVGLPEAFDPKGMDIYDFKPELKKLKGIAQIKFYIKTWCIDMTKPTLEIIDHIRKDFEPDIYISDPIVEAPYIVAQLEQKPSINLHSVILPLTSKDHGPFGTGIGPVKSVFGKLRVRLLNFVVNEIMFRDTRAHNNSILREFGVRPYKAYFNDFLASATTVFYTIVPGLDYPRSDMPKNIKYTGPVMSKNTRSEFERPDWWSQLDTGRPVVVVTQGTIANDISELVLPTIEALKDEEVILIALPIKSKIKNLPNNVKTASYIPFEILLPKVAVMVTNGGIGGIQVALSYGIPIVSSGGSEDKMEASTMVAHAGCGINLKKLSPSPKKIKQAVQEVLKGPNYKTNAERLQREIASYKPLELIAKEVDRLT